MLQRTIVGQPTKDYKIIFSPNFVVCEGLLLGGPPASSPHSGSDPPGYFYIKPGWPDLGVFHWGPLSTAELAVCLLLNFLNS